MIKRRIVIALFMFTAILFAGRSASADLKALIEVGKSQAQIAKALKEETKNYDKVKNAILSQKLKEGMPADRIRKKYGDPIIEIYDEKKNANKWLYMPATSTHFKGEKLYLFMDQEDNLVGWRIIEELAE